MNKKNVLKVALTVVLASTAISSGTYAYGVYHKANDPLAVTSSFYHEWLDYPANPLTDKFYQGHPALSQELEDKIDRIISGFDQGGYDPVLLAQDKPSEIEMEIDSMNDLTAIVMVTETFGNSSKELKVDLVKEGWKWQINNISNADAVDSQPLADNANLQTKVGDYIRDNISELSPENAVLGGTFYVTKIKFEGANKAIVEYEDGHIALQAEAQYEFLADGSVRIENFIIVDDFQD